MSVRWPVYVKQSPALPHTGSLAGSYETTPATKKTVTGSRGSNAALAALLVELARGGIIDDEPTGDEPPGEADGSD